MDDVARGPVVARRGCQRAAVAFIACCHPIGPLTKKERRGRRLSEGRDGGREASPALLGGCRGHRAAEYARVETWSWNRDDHPWPCSLHLFF